MIPTPSVTPPTPTRRIVTERRQRPLRMGIGLAIVAVLLLVVGGLMTFAAQALEVGTGERSRIGNSVRFDADTAEYSIVAIDLALIDSETFRGILVDITCTITAPDGTERSVDHDDVGGIRTETNAGIAMSRFDAVAGPTIVLCDWKDGRSQPTGVFYAVGQSRRTLDLIGLGTMGIAVASGLVGIWLITIGWRGRQVVQPI